MNDISLEEVWVTLLIAWPWLLLALFALYLLVKVQAPCFGEEPGPNVGAEELPARAPISRNHRSASDGTPG